jgi:hypothetical protein
MPANVNEKAARIPAGRGIAPKPQHQEAESAISGMLVVTFSNMDTIKLFSHQRDEDRDSPSRCG